MPHSAYLFVKVDYNAMLCKSCLGLLVSAPSAAGGGGWKQPVSNIIWARMFRRSAHRCSRGRYTSNEALAVGREAQQTVQAQRSIPTMGGAAGERGGLLFVFHVGLFRMTKHFRV